MLGLIAGYITHYTLVDLKWKKIHSIIIIISQINLYFDKQNGDKYMDCVTSTQGHDQSCITHDNTATLSARQL